jgi:hypothetical protein
MECWESWIYAERNLLLASENFKFEEKKVQTEKQ